jgi:hypothetical protein
LSNDAGLRGVEQAAQIMASAEALVREMSKVASANQQAK